MERSRTRERSAAALGVAVLLLAATASAGPRDVQFKSIDIANRVLELHNFGTETAALTGWRFCSHDENQTRVYSSSLALNGVMIGAGPSRSSSTSPMTLRLTRRT